MTSKALVLLSFITTVMGFKVTPATNRVSSLTNVGTTPPFSYFGDRFDPLGFTKNASVSKFAQFREAELKHGRLAMIATTTIPLLEMMSGEPGINYVSNLPIDKQYSLLALMGAIEFLSMLKGWRNPFVEGPNAAFKLKDEYLPGDLGFGVVDNLSSTEFLDLANKELNNGRLAMLGALGMIGQELVTGSTLF